MGYHTLETRQRVIELYLEGSLTQLDACEEIGVSLSSFKRWISRYRRGELLVPIIAGKGRPRKIDNSGELLIQNLIESNPSITLFEISHAIYKKNKIVAGRSVISRVLQKLNLRYKKLSISAAEKNTPEVKKRELYT